jgi:hypothetical protein
MISVDIAHPETDLETLRSLVQTAISPQERDAAYELFEYIFGESDEISDGSLETIIESDLQQNPSPDEPETVEELRQEIELQRNATHQSSSMNTFKNTLSDNLLTVMKYVFQGEGKNKALESQKRAISEDWDMNISVAVSNLIED